MKQLIIAFCALTIFSCGKSESAKQNFAPNCGCTTDSVLAYVKDSVGWLGFDSATKIYSIIDTVDYGFLNIFLVCNPEIKDINSIKLSNDSAVAVYYSGKMKKICPDTLLSLPEVFHYYITIDSLREK